jgi:predicted acetyltransferase
LEQVALPHRAAYLDMVDDFERDGELYGWNDAETARNDWAAFVVDVEREARGEGLPAGVCAQDTFIALDSFGRALGEIRLRPDPHVSEETILANHGHIGYNIRPTARGRGVATRMLALTLERARAAGLRRVMLTIEGENPASVKVIMRNGGQLTRRFIDPETGDMTAVYWIELV